MKETEKSYGHESGLWIEDKLRKSFIAEAVVTNPEKGYISVPSVNQRVNLIRQGWAADLIVNYYRQRGLSFDAVVGIPNSGIPLANSVAERLAIPLAPGRKGKDCPGAWKMPIIIDEEVPSFTTGERSNFVFNGIQEGDTVLAVEDVVALGNTMSLIAQEFQRMGISVCLATYFAKIFQGGIKRLQDMGIETFSAIEVESLLSEDGVWKVKLAPPHFPK